MRKLLALTVMFTTMYPATANDAHDKAKSRVVTWNCIGIALEGSACSSTPERHASSMTIAVVCISMVYAKHHSYLNKPGCLVDLNMPKSNCLGVTTSIAFKVWNINIYTRS